MYWVGQFDPRFWDPLCNQRQTSTSGPEPDISSHRISINIWINMKETSETCCDFIFTCFCRVMRSQSSTSQGFNSSGIFTFTSTRLVNISSWIHTHTLYDLAAFKSFCDSKCGFYTHGVDWFTHTGIKAYWRNDTGPGCFVLPWVWTSPPQHLSIFLILLTPQERSSVVILIKSPVPIHDDTYTLHCGINPSPLLSWPLGHLAAAGTFTWPWG